MALHIESYAHFAILFTLQKVSDLFIRLCPNWAMPYCLRLRSVALDDDSGKEYLIRFSPTGSNGALELQPGAHIPYKCCKCHSCGITGTVAEIRTRPDTLKLLRSVVYLMDHG